MAFFFFLLLVVGRLVVGEEEACLLGLAAVEFMISSERTVEIALRGSRNDSEAALQFAQKHGLESGAGCGDRACVVELVRSQLADARQSVAAAAKVFRSPEDLLTLVVVDEGNQSGAEAKLQLKATVPLESVAGLAAVKAEFQFRTDREGERSEPLRVVARETEVNVRVIGAWPGLRSVFLTLSTACGSVEKEERWWQRDPVTGKFWPGARTDATTFSAIGHPVIMNMGRGTYGLEDVDIYAWGATDKIEVGNFSSFGPKTTFILGGNHRADWLTTYPFPAYHPSAFGIIPSSSKGDIVIGSDVWVGLGVTFLSGVTVGHGAVVAAKAVVTKNVEPYSLVAGNPATHKKFRFDNDTITSLLKLKWWTWPDDTIVTHFHDLLRKPPGGSNPLFGDTQRPE